MFDFLKYLMKSMNRRVERKKELVSELITGSVLNSGLELCECEHANLRTIIQLSWSNTFLIDPSLQDVSVPQFIFD